ncbi:hypothetical protein [Wolbachia endosymbiont (group B) of Idaea biselata]|uniref:hypothetical protein n=1 Tax=Wolbachia endosymbiont (group B) of Idaea biselata TaxID=3066179 RepID=UPI003132AB39
MTNKNTTNDSQIRLEKMGIKGEIANKLLSFKNEGGELEYDSAFKIKDLSENTFVDKVKNTISVEEAKDIYQKALARREFVSRYIENAREMTEPHYRALRVCNIDHDTAEKCDTIIHSLQGE